MLRKLFVIAACSSTFLLTNSLCLAGTLPIQYAAPTSYATNNTRPYGVVAADFNSDGKTDMAAGVDGSVLMFLGNGDGTFQPAVPSPGVVFGDNLRTADFNNDGKSDLVITRPTASTVSVLINNGDGTFMPKVDYPSGGDLSLETITADLNNDGNIDLAFGHEGNVYYCVVAPCPFPPFDYQNSSNVAVLLGNGDGTFQAARKNTVDGRVTGIAVLDANGDGRPDLAAINSTKRKINLLYGLGNGVFLSAITTTVGTSASSGNLRSSDFNGDRIADLLMSHSASSIAISSGLGHAQFDSPKYLELSERTEVSDLDNDAIPDLISLWNGVFYIRLGAGDGTFLPRDMYAISGTLRTVAVADFDRDGLPDLAFANSSDKAVNVLLHRGSQMASPSVLSFPGMDLNNSSAPKIITITNSIGRPLTINAISTSGPDTAMFSVTPGGPNPCGTLTPTLAPNESCSIQVVFTPTLFSSRSATMMISSDHPLTPAYSIALSGLTNPWSLNINWGGAATGTVTVPPSTTYVSGPRTLYYSSSDPVVLQAAPGASANFSGWSGCDTVNGNQCTVTMNRHHTVTASFDPLQPIALESTTSRFTTLGSACASASDNSSFAVMAGNFTEQLLLSQPVSYQLRGGCDSSFASCSGTSTINGALTINAGSVAFENFKLKGALRVNGGKLVPRRLTVL